MRLMINKQQIQALTKFLQSPNDIEYPVGLKV